MQISCNLCKGYYEESCNCTCIKTFTENEVGSATSVTVTSVRMPELIKKRRKNMTKADRMNQYGNKRK